MFIILLLRQFHSVLKTLGDIRTPILHNLEKRTKTMGLDVVSLFVNNGLLVAKGRDYDPTILALSINVPVAPLSNNVFTDNSS